MPRLASPDVTRMKPGVGTSSRPRICAFSPPRGPGQSFNSLGDRGHAPNYGCQAIAGGTQHAEYTELAGSAVGLRDLDRELGVGARVLVGDLATIRAERSPDQQRQRNRAQQGEGSPSADHNCREEDDDDVGHGQECQRGLLGPVGNRRCLHRDEILELPSSHQSLARPHLPACDPVGAAGAPRSRSCSASSRR